VSGGEAAHLGWVMAHPARARQRVRAARVFISAGAPIYLYRRSRSCNGNVRDDKLRDKKRRAVGDRGPTGSGFGSPFTQIVYTEIKSLSLVRQRQSPATS
jgi:hypothetical protein